MRTLATCMWSSIKKFSKDPVRAAALLFILVCSLLALFAFVIVDDKTPDINEQIPGISLSAPGFSIDLLKVKRPVTSQAVSPIVALFKGKPSAYKFIPLSTYVISGDSIFFKAYESEVPSDSLPVRRLHLLQVLYGEDGLTDIRKSEGNYEFMKEGELYRKSINDVSDEVTKNSIVHRRYWFGTDIFGRSIFDRVLLGLRFSLLIGLMAVLISITIGTAIGMIAGYFGGKVDQVLNFIMNVFWSIPTLILVFAIVLVMGRGLQNIFIAVGLTMWVDAARLVRGQVLILKNEKYIEVVRGMGMWPGRIIFRHILPNMLGPLIVIAASNFATAIILESGLSYLGFGIQPPAPSLGSLLSENYGFILSGKPLFALIPVLILLLLVLAFNLVGNGIRDIFDVKSDN